MKKMSLAVRRCAQRGQSMIEYTIVVAMAVLILVQGGATAPVAMLIDAFKAVYKGFVYAISLASNLTFL